MPGILPHEPIQNDRRIKTFDVVALIDHPAPPRLFDVIAKFDAQRAIVPRAAKAAVDLRRWIDKTASFREGNDCFDVGCRH